MYTLILHLQKAHLHSPNHDKDPASHIVETTALGLNYSSQKGGNLRRDPYYDLKHNMGTPLVAILGQPPDWGIHQRVCQIMAQKA